MVLSLPNLTDKAYWSAIKQWALENNSDGCTLASDIYLPSCWEHDYHCRHHFTMLGEPLSSVEACNRFRQVIQMLSPAGRLSLVAQIRWAAVRYFGPQWDRPASISAHTV
jgi:hypothetical protein